MSDMILLLGKDILWKIALELDFDTIMNFALCNKKIRNILWDDRLFWKIKLHRDFNLSTERRSKKKVYKLISSKTPNEGFIEAAKYGWLDLVMYYVDGYDNLNYKQAIITAIHNKRKNVVRYFKKHDSIKNIVFSLTLFDLYALEL
jgi:tRNA nucleotidyltransferase/poly(A) polymerase